MNTELMTFGFEDKILAAYLLAVVSHKGQLRRGWEKYYLHCGRVGRQLQLWGCPEEVVIAGLLHDTVEDGHLSEEDLQDNGFSTWTIALVMHVTRDPDQSWDDYIQAIIDTGDVQLMMLKLADLNDNSTMHPKDWWEGWEEALVRYAKAKVRILTALRNMTPHSMSST